MTDPDEAAWYEGVRDVLEPAYLAAGDPHGQSGFRGDAARWERAQRPTARHLDHGAGVIEPHRRGTDAGRFVPTRTTAPVGQQLT